MTEKSEGKERNRPEGSEGEREGRGVKGEEEGENGGSGKRKENKCGWRPVGITVHAHVRCHPSPSPLFHAVNLKILFIHKSQLSGIAYCILRCSLHNLMCKNTTSLQLIYQRPMQTAEGTVLNTPMLCSTNFIFILGSGHSAM